MEPTSASDQFIQFLWGLGILSVFILWAAIIAGIVVFGAWLYKRKSQND